jgi:hypothetical protein
MNPIVSPLFFYFAMIADGLNFLFALIGFLGTCAIIILAIILCFMYNDCRTDEDFYLLAKKIFKWSIVVTAISWAAFIFMPSKEVLIEMEVAKYATPDNVKTVATEIIKVVKEMIH